MVKVISAYNFQEQNTYSINGDIIDTCLIGSDRLAIAQKNHIIEILCLKHKNLPLSYSTNTISSSLSSSNFANVFHSDQNENCPPTKTMFPTVDQVQKIMYCKTGHYLLTLEHKADCTDDIKKRFIRIYTNFDIAESDNCFSTPIRARIASKVTPKTDPINYIEVIEIPFNYNPDTITCCQTSGAIIVSSGKNLYFYELQNRENLAQKFTYIDFSEVAFYVELEFAPKKLLIEENVIGCMNETTAIAFKVIDLIETNTEDGSTSNSLATGSSANVFNQNTDDIPIDYEVAKQCNQINGIELFVKIRSNWDDESNASKSNFSEEKPVPVNDVKIILKYHDDYSHEHDGIYYSVKSLLQLRQPSIKVAVGQIHDEFRSIALKPIYYKSKQKSNEIKKCQNMHVLKSVNYENCIGFSFFVSTVSDGYLYQFTNQEKWYVENTKCLATYPFTAPVLDIIIDNYVIHAITECGIETFSSRIGHKLFSSYFEYPMLSAPYPNEIGPLLDVPICVMGICGFFGIKFVVNSDKNLVLLSTCDEKQLTTKIKPTTIGVNYKKQLIRSKSLDDKNDWTLYNLQLPKPQTLINDIKNLANIYKSTSPDIYYELMEEAHVIIRLARVFLNENSDNKEESDLLEKIYMDTCKLLAEYTIMSDRKEIYSQAVAYYSMCKYPVWEVYKRYITSVNESPKEIKNYNSLIYTLKILLSNLKSNKIDAEYLIQNVKPILHPDKKLNEYNVAEEFLDFFLTYAPNEISEICLTSSVFREILNDSLIQIFSKSTPEKLTSDDELCYTLCLFKNDQITKAIEILDKIQPKYLLRSLKKHWIIIFDNFNFDNYRKSTFSDFTEIILFSTNQSQIIEAIADLFIHLLLLVHYIDLDFILNRFMNYFALNLGQKGYRVSQQILEILLQGYFYDLYYLNNRNLDAGGKYIITEHINNTTNLMVNDSNHSSLCVINNLNDIEKQQQQQQQQQHTSTNNSSRKDSNGLLNILLTKQYDDTTNNITDFNYEDAEDEAMKILFRMYLGWLKQYSDTEQQQQQQQQKQQEQQQNQTKQMNHSELSELIGYRLAFIEYMFHHSKIIKRIHSKFDKLYMTDFSYGSDYMTSLYDDSGCIQLTTTPIMTATNINKNDDNTSNDSNDSGNNEDKQLFFRRRPIIFFERREQFLNTMPPFDENSFKMDTDGSLYFDDWDKPVNVILIKIQSLLNSGKLGGNLIDDFIAFIHSNPNVIGIDSLITLLLPKSECEEFLIHIMPKNLLNYAKSRLTSPQQWQSLIKKILNKKRELPNTNTETSKLYNKLIYEILEHLANEKSLEDFLNCVPDEELNKNRDNNAKLINHNYGNISIWNQQQNQQQQHQHSAEQEIQNVEHDDVDNSSIRLRKHSYDGIDETDPFQLIMRTVVAKQRSDALCAMIQSTGRQLYDAMNNSQLHLN